MLTGMIFEYVTKGLQKATCKRLEDNSWFGEVPGFEGVWANGPSVEHCRKELIDVMEEWIMLKLRDHETLPDLDGLKLEVRKVA